MKTLLVLAVVSVILYSLLGPKAISALAIGLLIIYVIIVRSKGIVEKTRTSLAVGAVFGLIAMSFSMAFVNWFWPLVFAR